MAIWSELFWKRGLLIVLAAVSCWIFASAKVESAQTVRLTGNHPPEGVRLTRPASAQLVLHIRLKFALRDRDALDRLLSDLQDPTSPRYQQWLTPSQFERRFGQPKAQIQAVRRWLSGQGFRLARVTADEIDVIASAAQVENAFSISIVTSENGLLYANRNDPAIPSRFAGIIGMIDGLDNLRRSMPMAIRGPAISTTSLAFAPSNFYAFYNETPLLNAGINGASLGRPPPGPVPVYGCGIALVETSDYLDAAVASFNTMYSLPPLQNGTNGIKRIFPSNSNPGRNSSEPEALLDIEWSHAIAPAAIIQVYISSDLSAAISAAISDKRNCWTLSISFSFCGATTSFYQNLDSLFARAAAQGQSVFVAAGDEGAAGEVPSGTGCVVGNSRGVNEMAASPNVTAVGGTEFTPNSAGGVSESTWNDLSGATGGGRSTIFPKPTYQNGITPSDGARDIPDIAFAASPGSPGFYTVVDRNGQPSLEIYGGTSIAAPMWAGVARLISQRSRPVGFGPNRHLGNINREIYKLGAASRGVRDVTIGNNSFNGVTGYNAGPGYDQTTGWGTVDITNFVNAYSADVCSICSFAERLRWRSARQ